MACDVPHPERPLRCEMDAGTPHRNHSAWTPEEVVIWDNALYTAPVRERPARTRAEQQPGIERLHNAAQAIRDAQTPPDQLSDPAMPEVQVHADPTDTEVEAALHELPRSGTHRMMVLEAIAGAPEGLSDPEVAEITGIYLYSAAPRRVELVTGGWVEDSGVRRPTARGNDAIVWRLTAQGRERLVPTPTFAMRDFG